MPAPTPKPPFYQTPRPISDVADPENVSSDVAPLDRKRQAPLPPEDEARWVQYGMSRFTDAKNGARRQDMENRALASLAVLDEGAGQWFHWTGADALSTYNLTSSLFDTPQAHAYSGPATRSSHAKTPTRRADASLVG